MSIYSDSPQVRTPRENNPTLLVCWWCTIFSICIILFRVYGRYIRAGSLFTVDRIAFVCIIPLVCRMVAVHFVLLHGTNNTLTLNLTEKQIRWRILGSKLVLVSRILYAATLWMLKLTISEFLKGLIKATSSSYPKKILKAIRWFLLFTFLFIIIENLTACLPFPHNWQVIPDPGPRCRQAFSQLLTLGIANIITDLLLIIFPIPIILHSQMGFKMKTQLIFLLSLSLMPVCMTLYRLPRIIDRHGAQHFRSLMASIEILFATTAANALALGSFLRDRGPKKPKFKPYSPIQSVEPVDSLREKIIRFWGSDNNLVRDMGLGLDPELLPPSAHIRSSSHSTHEIRFGLSDRPDSIETSASPLHPYKRFSSPDSSISKRDQCTLRLSNGTIISDSESSTFDRASPLPSQQISGLSPPPLRRVYSAPTCGFSSYRIQIRKFPSIQDSPC